MLRLCAVRALEDTSRDALHISAMSEMAQRVKAKERGKEKRQQDGLGLYSQIIFEFAEYSPLEHLKNIAFQAFAPRTLLFREIMVHIQQKKRWLVVVVLLLSGAVLLLSAPAQARSKAVAGISAADFVSAKSESLLAVIKQEKKGYKEDPELFIDAIKAELVPILDMRVAVGRVMGAYYAQASKGQRKCFGIVFRDSLIESFAKAVAEFDFDRIDVVSSTQKADSRKAVVGMNVRTRSGSITLSYSLYLTSSGSWKLYNIRVDGADLTSVYIGQFASRMAVDKDIDKVIDNWEG